MSALTTLTSHYPVTPLRRTRTRLQLPARSDAGHALQGAVTTLVLAITGGLEPHVLGGQRVNEALLSLRRSIRGATRP